MKKIPLTKGKYAIVDDADFKWLNLFSWYAEPHKRTWYARTTVNGRFVRMHSLLMDTKDGYMADHRNRNGLDNRRHNLRNCTRSENLQNQKRLAVGTSRYKGVYRNKDGKYCAQITIDGKTKGLGLFGDEQYAARVYNAAAERYFGKFACLNVIVPKNKTYPLFGGAA